MYGPSTCILTVSKIIRINLILSLFQAGNFVSGNKITISVTANYEVGSFGGTKTLVISSLGASGGKNKSVGIAYITVGTLLLVFGVLGVIKEFLLSKSG